MSDRLCYGCNDQGGKCCSEWCYKERRWVFVRCTHYDCWVENGRQGFPPNKDDEYVGKHRA